MLGSTFFSVSVHRSSSLKKPGQVSIFAYFCVCARLRRAFTFCQKCTNFFIAAWAPLGAIFRPFLFFTGIHGPELRAFFRLKKAAFLLSQTAGARRRRAPILSASRRHPAGAAGGAGRCRAAPGGTRRRPAAPGRARLRRSSSLHPAEPTPLSR